MYLPWDWSSGPKRGRRHLTLEGCPVCADPLADDRGKQVMELRPVSVGDRHHLQPGRRVARSPLGGPDSLRGALTLSGGEPGEHQAIGDRAAVSRGRLQLPGLRCREHEHVRQLLRW